MRVELACVCRVNDGMDRAESWWDRPTDSIALLSSGGMSAQVTFVSDRKLHAVSLRASHQANVGSLSHAVSLTFRYFAAAHEQKLANGRCRDPSVSVLSAES